MSRRSAWQAFAAALGIGRSSGKSGSENREVAGSDAVVAVPESEPSAPAHEATAPAASPADERAEIPADAARLKPAVPVAAQRFQGLEGDLEANSIRIGENITLVGAVHGTGNVIRIAGTRNPQKVHLTIYGNNNRVAIGARSLMQSLRIEFGSPRWPCSRARLRIGKGFSIGSQSRLILANSGNVIQIGDHCMFSSGITVRGGEYPHLVFDKETGAYLDVSEGIFIGDHVWIGEGAFIGKAVTIPNECIVGTKSVVTKRFTEENCVIAGNPARIVKRGVQWVAHELLLKQDFPEWHKSFQKTRVGKINRTEKKNA